MRRIKLLLAACCIFILSVQAQKLDKFIVSVNGKFFTTVPILDMNKVLKVSVNKDTIINYNGRSYLGYMEITGISTIKWSSLTYIKKDSLPNISTMADVIYKVDDNIITENPDSTMIDVDFVDSAKLLNVSYSNTKIICIYTKDYKKESPEKQKSCKIPESTKLFIIKDSVTNKFGFEDSKGKMIIPCIYSFAYDFNEGLAAVEDSSIHKYGYINTRGEVVIPFKYDEVSSFGQDRNGNTAFKGFAYVNIGMNKEYIGMMFTDGKWGLINKKGEEVLPIKYGYISPVNDNMASFLAGKFNAKDNKIDGKMGFVNEKGKIVIPAIYDFVYDIWFVNGFVTVEKNGAKYKIDKNGKVID